MAKLLYIEDNENNIYMLSNRLRRKGYEVLIARDGKAGIETALDKLPDLIIMDLILPELDGWEATRRLKGHPNTNHIPIIALSASAMPGDDLVAFEAGCNDFETKPVDFSSLLEKIKTLLE
jgi:two-component system cell cycle response regulator DivK